jgi:polyhydroxyalkanoate synthase
MAKPQLFTSARNARDRFLRPETLNQAGQTPFEVIDESELVTVRYYPPLAEASIKLGDEDVAVEKTPRRTPLVIVPPLAVNMLIYDLFPNRSLVKYLRARGFELYLIDWGRPGKDHDDHRLATYFAEMLPEKLALIREHAGTQRLSLHGWSFGGLFSYCYTALTQDKDIANLVLVGAPADYHRNGQLGKQYQRLSRQGHWLRRNTGLNVRRLPKRFFRSPGWANSLAFKLINPVGTAKGYQELLRNLGDRNYVRDHATNAAFLEDMVAYPGGVIQDIIHYLWVGNVLAENRLPMRDSEATLDRITASILSIVGRNDTIVTAACSERLLEYVSSDDVRFETVPGGHMGILGGSQAAKASWGMIADWLVDRD